ncbi:MAG: methanolan biosynthesis protein EpsI [Deltaproteobacteria bacterium]|jgi:hypothetical protein|nr:methanolan biosynthesis protein EpsI [Deltaproteobacteria bacterium]MBT4640689.1 methanolan biosynthesis protein EpsI [Deltaproteobacteria bacterium]MBT7483150.1 methanolan biosynthesis protein EpsI [Candidatus Peregrinibacteria bacterium]
MFLYILGLVTLIGILGVACYAILITTRKEGLKRSNEYKVLQSPDTVVDEIIKELIKIDNKHGSKDVLEERKQEILSTFIELYKSGSFCAHLTEEEVIRFVKHKLFILEINENEC